MEFLRRLSLEQLIIGFVIIVVVIVIGVLVTRDANQPVVIDYTVTTPTPFIDFSNTPIVIPITITDVP